MKTSTTLLAITALAGSVSAHPEFRALIPNALNVKGVDAIGHVNTEGGGPRNKFGLDFAAAGLTWTKELCEKDSDGDGQTNGQELGDPCCAWVQKTNAKVLWTDGVSAPGDATKKSDPSLWAGVSCGSGSGSNTTATMTTAPSSTTAASTTPSSTTAVPTTANSNATATTPSPTTTKSGVASVATLAVTAGAVTITSVFFA